MTSLYYGFWDYWELHHKVTFDGVNKLILINEGETSIDIQRDIYSAWKEWVRQESNSRYLKALNVIGGESTVGDEKLDATYFLINGWRIKPYPGSYTLTLTGNIFEVDGGEIKVDADINPLFPNNITINLNTSVIVRRLETTSSGSFSNNVTASLVPAQSASLSSIETQINSMNTWLKEVWQMHGLENGSELKVTQTSRTFANVSQSISTVGSGSSQETTINRV